MPLWGFQERWGDVHQVELSLSTGVMLGKYARISSGPVSVAGAVAYST